jgi:hypothetical protein
MVRPLSCLRADAATSGRGGGRAGRFFGTDSSYRWAWNTPIVFSTVTPGVVYSAGNVLFRSDDRGGSWKAISPDLTSRVNRDTVRIMGKTIGRVNYSPGGGPAANPNLSATFGTITWIGESPLNGRVLYVGTDDGQVQVTRDGGTTWTNVTKNLPGLPPFNWVSTVLPSQHVAGRVYATFDGHFNNDERAYVYVSDDYGRNWRSITNGLPVASVFRIAEDPKSANVLVVGHVRGVHFSNDGGASWHSLSTNMPTIPVRSVVFHPRDDALILGTYGRGAWILDDVGPLRALTPEGVKSDALLVSITRGRQWNLSSLGPTYGSGEFYAPNPEFDPVISYYARDAASGAATITIRDGLGNLVRTLEGPAASGVNRVTWDMHMDSAMPAEAAAGGGRGGRAGGGGGGRGGGRGGGSAAGPLVLPGKYSVSIAIPGVSKSLRGELTVQGDASDGFSAAERRVRQDALMNVYRFQKALVAARTAAATLVGETGAIKRDVEPGGTDATIKADSLTERIARVHAELDRVLGIAGSLLRAIESFNSAPTADQRTHLSWALDDATAAVTALNRVSQTDIPALYSRYAKGTTPRIVPPVTLPVRTP